MSGFAAFAVVLECIVAGTLFLLWRNNRVYVFRRDLIARCSAAAEQDIANGRYDWQWRYDALEAVSYDRMLLSLCPLRPQSFYDDLSFLTARQAVKR